MGTILLTDSCCDLTLEYVEANSDILDILGMPVNIDGYEYLDDYGKSLSHAEFYSKLREGIMPSTAQINSFRFYETFKKHYNQGNSVLYLGFSSNLSGTFFNAVMARNEFVEKHPDADITVIDTLSASVGQSVMILTAIEMLRQGSNKEQIVQWAEDNKMNVNHWFAVDDLNYLKKGGRISAATAIVGSALNIKPILTVDREGRLGSYSNVRGRKKSVKFIADKLGENIINLQDAIVIIGHGNCPEDAKLLEGYILEKGTPKQLMVCELSATIASHVGPNMIAAAFIGETREQK